VAFGVPAVFDPFKEPRVPARAHFRVAELANRALLDAATELRGHRLHPVADPEHRHAERPHSVRRPRRVAFGHAVRAARQDDSLRRKGAHERVVDVERVDLAIDVRLAQAARDQLRVLRAEIEDQNPRMRWRCHRLRRRQPPRHKPEIVRFS